MADLFDNLNEWLLSQALSDDDISVTMGGLAQRLQDGGLPIARISMGRTVLHPVIALIDMQWHSDTGRVQMQTVPRKALTPDFLDGTPFGELSTKKTDHVFADLRNPDEVRRYKIFQEFADEGLTGYAAFSRRFGRDYGFKNYADGLFGASVSFATKRFSGFTEADVAGLERLVSALCVCTRVDNDRFLAKEILEAYLGRISGDLVLGGQVSRGDGREIECALFYSDLRGSLVLSQQLDTQTYLDTVNAYFECTVNAVHDHGGEVLKLIGDGILAIFPFEDKVRPRANMCAAALASGREAFARAAYLNEARQKDDLPEIEFGIALNVGNVIYGNVGTEKRLDFTATGPAVGLAARVEALTRKLGKPLLATKSFAQLCGDVSVEISEQEIRDFDEPVQLVHYEV